MYLSPSGAYMPAFRKRAPPPPGDAPGSPIRRLLPPLPTRAQVAVCAGMLTACRAARLGEGGSSLVIPAKELCFAE